MSMKRREFVTLLGGALSRVLVWGRLM